MTPRETWGFAAVKFRKGRRSSLAFDPLSLLGKLQVLLQEVKRSPTIDLVQSIEDFDLGPIADS